MPSEDKIIPCQFSRMEAGKRLQLECSAIERLDCFELLVDQPGRFTNTPWPGKTLRLPKSLFRILSDEFESCGLQLLMPLDMDEIEPPKTPVVSASFETSSSAEEEPLPVAKTPQAAGAAK